MLRQIKAGETSATRRQIYFHLVTTDGITAAIFEAAGQPQISTNGAAFTNTGISTLSAIGTGRYYATLTAGAVATVGDIIETRYKSANTAECPGELIEIVDYDPTIGGEATVVGHTAAGSDDITIVQGEACSAAFGRQITMTLTSSLTLTSGVVVLVVHDGRLVCTMTAVLTSLWTLTAEPTAAQTSALGPGTYPYQIWFTPTSAEPFTLIEGNFIVVDDERG